MAAEGNQKKLIIVGVVAALAVAGAGYAFLGGGSGSDNAPGRTQGAVQKKVREVPERETRSREAAPRERKTVQEGPRRDTRVRQRRIDDSDEPTQKRRRRGGGGGEKEKKITPAA